MSGTYDPAQNLGSHWEKVLQGDARAYSHLHDALHPVLYRYALAMLADEGLAADVVQELFIRLWFKKESIGPLRNVKAFFMTALRRQTLNQLRSLRLLLVALPAGPDIAFSQEDILIAAEQEASLRQRIAGILNRLPRRQKEVIYLHYYEGLSYDEIAGIMGIHYQSVINHAHKAILQLRKEMGR